MVGKNSEETSFPRGAVLSTIPNNDKADVVKVKKVEKELFGNKQVKNVKKKKDKDKKKKTTSVFDIVTVPTLTYTQLSEGQVVLGVISQVLEFELKVSLPGRLVGTIPITNVSPALTARLRALADDGGGDDDVPSLSSLYKLGQVVMVAVISVSQAGSRYNLILSLWPSRVGASRVPSQGDICCAAVSSKEDHGYIMDIGSTTVRGFVSNKAMSKLGEVEIGQVLWSQVTRTEAGVVTLNPTKVWGAEVTNPTVHNLVPGSRVKATVESHLGNGLKVTLKDGLAGFVHQNQFRLPTDPIESYEVGSEVEVRVVYIVPTVNTIILTLREVKHKVDPFGGIKPGDLVEGATVEQSMSKSILLRLQEAEDTFGLVTAKNVTEPGKEIVKNLKKKYPVGGKVTARIIALDFSSGVAVCSLHRSLLSGIQRLDQLTIGQKLTVIVKSFVRPGLVVEVGPHLTGLIPSLFLSDVTLSKPELKYLPGDKLACKVLKLNPATNQLHLTSKPVLVNNDNFTIVSSYETAVPGTITEGVVVKVSREGLLLQLWGDMRGFVPKSQLSLETIEYPEKLFFLGQAVKCRLLDSDKDRDKVILSLILDSMKPLGRREKVSQVLEVGDIHTGTISRITDKGAEVKVVSKGMASVVTLPTQHLTDDVGLAEIIKSSLTVGQEVSGLVWHKDVVTIISKKSSLVDSWSDLPKDLADYEVGLVVPGVVQLIKPFGVMLRVPGMSNLVLAPTRHLQDYFVDNPVGLVDIGQTLMCRVLQVDREQEKLTVSTSVSGVLDKQKLVETGAELVTQWLDYTAEHRSGPAMGSLVTGKITQVTEFGYMLDIDGVQGIVTNTNLGRQQGELDVGDSVSGVVVFVDRVMGGVCVELSCEGGLVSRTTTKRGDVVTKGNVVKGEVVLVKTELSLCVVSITHPKNVSGHVGYLGTRRHINDLAGIDVEQGKEVTVVVGDVTSKGELVMVLEREVRSQKRRRLESENIEKANVSADNSACPIGDDSMEEKPKKKKKKSKQKSSDMMSPSKDEEHEEVVESNDILDVAATLDTSIVDSTTGKSKSEKKKKKAKEVNDVTSDEKSMTSLVDPGWDYSATSVTRPAWQSTSIWSDEEEDPEEEEEKKHVSKAEARRLKRQEEEEAAKREQRVLDGEVDTPTTEAEFERLVMASPDSSLVWVQYMACCMQGGELDKARAVAKRALGRINFRLESERLNVFLAWLNLENTFGSPEALDVVLKEALQCQDQFKVYSQMAAIYSQTSKVTEAEKIYKIIVRKFSKEKEVWIKYGVFYYKNNRLSDGRFVLQRSLQSLDKRDHLDITTKFAQIEFRYGDAERGKTMFETILANYPRRTDLWSVYVDQLVKTGDTDAARALYKRMSTLDLQARRMKFLFKKWLDFETVHGTEAGVSEVKQSAQKYLEGRGGGVDTEEMETE